MLPAHATTRNQSGVYGVVGQGIGYSLSPHIFRTVFSALSWSADYAVFDIGKSELPGLLDAMRSAPIRGLSVTKPYKELVIKHLDRLDHSAAIVGAVNTVALERGRLIGYNTDVDGVVAALGRCRAKLRGKDAVVFGAGGGARAVSYAVLKHLGMRSVTIAARRPGHAQRLIRDLQNRMPPATVASAAFRPATDLIESLSGAALVVNATPLGTGASQARGPLPKGVKLRRGTIAFDLVYRPRPTAFCKDARRAGCSLTIDGWPMLIAQAEAAFALWTGKRFPEMTRRKLLAKKSLP